MRRRIPIGAVLGWTLGCLAGEAPVSVPELPVAPPLAVDAWAGRWEALTEHEGRDVVLTPCDRENHFLEVRSDGDVGWEVLAGTGQELRIAAVVGVEPAAHGVTLKLDDGEPVTVAWIESERTAAITPLFAGERFVAPKLRAETPVVEASCPEAP